MTDVLNLPRPAWMSEDVALLDETACSFDSPRASCLKER